MLLTTLLFSIFFHYSDGFACDGTTNCLILSWEPWTDCSGVCGLQQQNRTRYICCPMEVNSKTEENCLAACNYSRTYPLHEKRPCCEHGQYSLGKCSCYQGFKGPCCQDVVTCGDDPCKHGTCTDTGVSFTCNCDIGYTGVVCDTHLTCNDIPCLNDGTCTDAGSDFQCTCPYTHKGNFCQTALTCTDNPCLHDGKCIDPGTGFQCTCPNTHKGNVCEIALISEKTSQLLLPEWLPSLEYGILSIVSVIGLMTTGCVCLKCCKALGVMDERRDEDTDDEDEEENFRKTRKNVTFPDEYVKSKSKWMDF